MCKKEVAEGRAKILIDFAESTVEKNVQLTLDNVPFVESCSKQEVPGI